MQVQVQEQMRMRMQMQMQMQQQMQAQAQAQEAVSWCCPVIGLPQQHHRSGSCAWRLAGSTDGWFVLLAGCCVL